MQTSGSAKPFYDQQSLVFIISPSLCPPLKHHLLWPRTHLTLLILLPSFLKCYLGLRRHLSVSCLIYLNHESMSESLLWFLFLKTSVLPGGLCCGVFVRHFSETLIKLCVWVALSNQIVCCSSLTPLSLYVY